MPPSPGKQPPPESTRLESPEEVRQAILAAQAKRPAKAPPKGPHAPAAAAAAPPPPPEPETPAERPQQRPPMAMICVLDDGKQDGEWVRLRADRTAFGRADGDVRIPHDVMMSGRHAEITRQSAKEGYRWILTDLGSTNGTYVRVGTTLLRHMSELIVGRVHYRFESGAAAPAAEEPPRGEQTTRAWTAEPIRSLVPSLVEMTPSGTGQRWALSLAEYWIGRDPKACAIARTDDLFLDPRHARLHRDAKGHWHAENNRTVNGLWLRVEEIPLGATCQFRMGEQKFLFRVL